MKKGYMKAVYINCKQCNHNWWQKVDETKLLEAPCRCGVEIDMFGHEGMYGTEFIEVLQTKTLALGSFERHKSKITIEDRIIA